MMSLNTLELRDCPFENAILNNTRLWNGMEFENNILHGYRFIWAHFILAMVSLG